MATGDVLNVCNRALLSIGSRAQISSLQEASPQADACNTLYTPCFESLARSANWNCLRNQATLSLLAAAVGTPENPDGTTLPLPPTPFLYSYALPSDCLQVRFLVPSSLSQTGGIPQTTASVGAPYWIPGAEQIDFVVAYSTDTSGSPINVILTDQEQAQVVYTVNQPNPQIWDSDFQSAMVASLAAYLVPALGLNIPLMDRQLKIAEELVARARVRDGDEGVTCQDHVPDFIRARGWNAGWNGWNESPWLNPWSR